MRYAIVIEKAGATSRRFFSFGRAVCATKVLELSQRTLSAGSGHTCQHDYLICKQCVRVINIQQFRRRS